MTLSNRFAIGWFKYQCLSINIFISIKSSRFLQLRNLHKIFSKNLKMRNMFLNVLKMSSGKQNALFDSSNCYGRSKKDNTSVTLNGTLVTQNESLRYNALFI